MNVPWAATVYILAIIVVVACLHRGHRNGHIDLWDTVRTSKDGKTFTDPRKLFEAGVFAIMTITFAYLGLLDKMSEWYAAIYVSAFVTARVMRDREQRLNKLMEYTHGQGQAGTAPKTS